MRKPAWAAVAVIVISLAGFWWWHHRARETPARATDEAHADRGLPRAGSRGEGRDDLQPPPIVFDDDPAGQLRLEGIVLDGDDKPVAGATVVLGSYPPRTVITEGDGGFAFDHLVGRAYTLVARAKHGVAGPVTARLTTNSPPVELRLRAAARVTVTVAGLDGKSVDGATVELRGTDAQRELTKAGTAVFATVVPGAYQVAAWTDHTARTLQWLSVGAGETQARIVLVAGAAVAGRVVDERGAPVAGASVAFHGASDWSQQADRRYDAITTAADGAFRFDAVAAGSFRFSAAHPSFAPGSSPLVTLDGKNERTGITIELASGAIVRGRVVDGEHKAISGVRVRIGTASRRGMIFETPRQAYSDDAGAFEVKGLPRRELAAVALHESGSSATRDIDATGGDVANVELVIDRTGTIVGVVVDPEGHPIEAAQVSAGPNFRDQRSSGDFSNWRLRGFPEDLTDASGKFTLTGLAPGSYQVTALRSAAAARGRRGATEGVVAEAGTRDLKIVLAPEGAVKGRVAFGDGTAPAAFTVSVGMTQQAFAGDSAFELDALAPQHYELQVRGPAFQTRAVDVTIEPGKTADLGTIQVEQGRVLAGTVVADGQPVAGATVSAGRQVMGNGTSSTASFGPMGANTKTTTTGPDGTFSLAGFGGGDLTLVADHPDIGRSKAMRVPQDLPGQSELVLELQKFGALSGVMHQGGKPAEGIFVSCQSTTTPGAIYAVASGPDGRYRYDRLAPDTYKVSATVGMPMAGMKFYSKEVAVPSGKEVTVDLSVDPGSVTVNVQGVPKSGKPLGIASVWLASGTGVSAATASQLQLQLAAAGPGASQWVIVRAGEPARFSEVAPGSYTACVVPFPSEVQGMAAMGYTERHGDKLPAYCQAVTVAASPDVQSVNVSVEISPYVPDTPGGGGSGSGH
jgi:protocatechuate 3,4-dioxygenase beta subunit